MTSMRRERETPGRKASMAACGRRRTGRVKDTRALNAHKALCAAPISMGRGEIPVELCQQPSVLPLSLLSFMKGDFIMQDKATNPGKINRPEKNPLDAKTTYHIGNRSFVVEPVFKKESPDTLGSVLLRLMKSESEKL